MPITRHQYQVFIKASPEQVWNAVIDPAFTRRYFHGTAFDAPPVAGEPYRTSLGNGEGAVDGVIEIAEAPNRLVMTWHTLYDEALAAEPPSRVEWLIESAGEGLTRVQLIHGDLALSPLTWANVKDGWVWILDGMKTLLETGETLPPTVSLAPPLEDVAGEWHRAQGIEANNSLWPMMEKADRTADEDAELVRTAYAASYHWARAARRTTANEARAEWMLSRVHVVVGRGETALLHAQRSAAAVAAGGLTDFDAGYAHEALARAYACLGRDEEAAAELARAKLESIADEEDRKIFEGDLTSEPWFALSPH